MANQRYDYTFGLSYFLLTINLNQTKEVKCAFPLRCKKKIYIYIFLALNLKKKVFLFLHSFCHVFLLFASEDFAVTPTDIFCLNIRQVKAILFPLGSLGNVKWRQRHKTII